MAPEITVRPWERRKDRSEIESWPAAELPSHWSDTGPSTSMGPRQSWAVEEGGHLVGRITLRDISQASNSGQLGIYLRPDRYGQGIGSEALTRFLAVSPVVFLWLHVAEDNFRALRCYTKCGFLELGHRPGPVTQFVVMGRYVHASDRIANNGTVRGAVHRGVFCILPLHHQEE